MQLSLRKGWKPTIRKITGLEAMEEAVGRATEMGRPVHFTAGLSNLTDSTWGPLIIAGISILGHLAGLCARYNTRLIVSSAQPDTLPLVHETLRTAYLTEGKPDAYTPDMIRYLSDQQFAYAAGIQGTLVREKCAVNVMVGPFYAESLIFAEAGFIGGAIQIAGTGRMLQQSFFAVVCDYNIIGEECYAAGAYVSKDPVQLASIAGQDLGKFVAVALIIVGAILMIFGVDLARLMRI